MTLVRNNLIYDVGAHTGEDTEFYLKKGFDVVAVEANPDLNSRIRERFKSNIDNGRLVLVEAAIAERKGEIDFFLNESESVWGTIRSEWAERNRRLGAPSKKITVKAVTLDSLLQEYGIPRYLKVDIEGSDLLCLESLTHLGARPRFVSIESDKESWDGLLHEFEIFQQLGYDRFKIVDQRQTHRHAIPHPSREGCHVEHDFQPECSGLFGDELPGHWLTAQEAIQQYETIFAKYRLYGDFGTHRDKMGIRVLRRLPFIGGYWRASWFDTHAKNGTA